MKNGKSTRLVLPCTDDNDNFMCFLCHKYVESGHTLYRHMCCHTYSDWREVLPETLENCSAVIVRKTLFSSDNESVSDDDVSINEEEFNGSVADLTLALPRWNATGKVKNKRGKQDFKNDDSTKNINKCDEVVPEEVGLSGNKGNVVFDFDLNDDAVIETEDEICSQSIVCHVDA